MPQWSALRYPYMPTSLWLWIACHELRSFGSSARQVLASSFVKCCFTLTSAHSSFLRAKHEVLDFLHNVQRGWVGGSPLSREPTEVKHYARKARLPRFTLTSAHSSFLRAKHEVLDFLHNVQPSPSDKRHPSTRRGVGRETRHDRGEQERGEDLLTCEAFDRSHVGCRHARRRIKRCFPGGPQVSQKCIRIPPSPCPKDMGFESSCPHC